MQRVGIRGLKSHLSEYLSKVRAGERIVVTDRGVEVAEIVPISRERRVMQRLVAENKVRWSGSKPAGIQGIHSKGKAIAETVVEDRR
ncbi:MAG: type II toxin-antitoxin system prevent-host-death family antitoxin [Gammaproteobacteria bacterium]|jgi:prevent-host-death family protein|nr:type II toxin-antitoxin system prevent-host-death family antitoxin [Gammaproteobacteria bacterium]